VEIDGERPVGGQVVLSGVAGTRISYAHAFGTDGRFLADVVVGETARYMSLIARSALLRAPSDLTRVAQPLIQSPGNQGLADLSQDGNWFAYTSDESGPYEVWAARLPIRGSPVKVSPGGCELPRWSPKNDGLYYRCGQRWFWSALTGRDDPVFAPSELFVEGDYLNISGPEYAVSPDGSRLMLLRGSGERTTTTLDMIINWRAELERRLPAQR
jgi:hypothetical protein